MFISWTRLRLGTAPIILAGITLGSGCGWPQFGLRNQQSPSSTQERTSENAISQQWDRESAAQLAAQTAAWPQMPQQMPAPGRPPANQLPAAPAAAAQSFPNAAGFPSYPAAAPAGENGGAQAGLLDAESQQINLVRWLREDDSAAQPPAGAAMPIPAPMDDFDVALSDLFGQEFTSIDLASALNLAGVQNPELLLARQRVVESVAERQLAAAELLPSLRLGLSYDGHTGPLQQSFGNILRVTRNSLYVGAGAYAIAAGTVNIPGVYWNDNVSDAIFRYLASRQVVEQHELHSRAVENDVLRRVGLAYTDLLRAVGNRAIAYENERDAAEVVRLTEAFARAGAGREADADRARSELAAFTSVLRESEGEVLIASADLAEMLNLDPSMRLAPLEERYVPLPYVPDPIPLSELVAIALVQRPELRAQQANIQRSMLQLRSARILPFSPNVILGLSAGGEGGGSNIVAQPAGTTPFATAAADENGTGRFGNSGPRMDFDAVSYWMLKNLGIGNRAMIREAESHLQTSELQWLAELDNVRMSVAQAYARTHANFAQILTAEQAVRDATRAFEEDKRRIAGFAGLPIELLDALRLVSQTRQEYFQAIVAYNQAQLDLYVALGQPPVAVLARPAEQEELLPANGGGGNNLPPVPGTPPPAANREENG